MIISQKGHVVTRAIAMAVTLPGRSVRRTLSDSCAPAVCLPWLTDGVSALPVTWQDRGAYKRGQETFSIKEKQGKTKEPSSPVFLPAANDLRRQRSKRVFSA